MNRDGPSVPITYVPYYIFLISKLAAPPPAICRLTDQHLDYSSVSLQLNTKHVFYKPIATFDQWILIDLWVS